MTSPKFDPFNPFAGLDPSRFDLGKMMEQFKVPGVDTESLMASQRKNIEALTAANKAAVEGMQALAARQSELFTRAMSEANEVLRELAATRNPQEISAKQAEVLRNAFEQALANMRELAEMVQKANLEAYEHINRRMQEGLKELQSLAEKKK